MLSALTVRTLKPGTFDEFRVAFTRGCRFQRWVERLM
jgi:hypothetical protein